MEHLDPGQRVARAYERLETEHRPHSALNASMILLDTVVEVSALADANPLRSAPGAIPQSVVGIAGDDRFAVGLAAVDDDPLGPAMAFKRFPEEPLGRRQVAVFAEPELNGVAGAVDRAIERHPLSANLDVGLIDMPFAGDGALAPIEALQQQRREVNDPAVDRRMVDADAALRHHFLQVAQAQAVGQIPADAKQDH